MNNISSCVQSRIRISILYITKLNELTYIYKECLIDREETNSSFEEKNSAHYVSMSSNFNYIVPPLYARDVHLNHAFFPFSFIRSLIKVEY